VYCFFVVVIIVIDPEMRRKMCANSRPSKNHCQCCGWLWKHLVHQWLEATRLFMF